VQAQGFSMPAPEGRPHDQSLLLHKLLQEGPGPFRKLREESKIY
jgi:hypothetical protein